MKDYKLEDEMRLKRSKDIDMQMIKNGLKENKHLKRKFDTKINEIQRYIGANINYNRDIQDDRYKYNYLRDRLWKKKNSMNVQSVKE